MLNPANRDLATPASGLQKSKRFHHKSRDSCNSCRRRRVKCTLERPKCKACVRLSLDCEYRIDRGHIDVRKLEGGQTFIIPVTSKALLPAHFETAKISFWILNTIPLLSSVGLPSKSNNNTPSLFTDRYDRPVFTNAYQSFDRMWRLLILPLAYTEKSVFDMLALIGNQHQLALQLDGQQKAFQTQAYAHMLYLVSSITKKGSTELVLAAISTLFAYERLASAATATDPPDKFTVHSNALKSLIAQPGIKPSMLSYFSGPAIFSESMRSFFLNKSRSSTIESSTLAIPDEFKDLFVARDCIFAILEMHDNNDQTRKHLTHWVTAMRIYFERCKESDWNDAKKTLTMLTEFEYLRTIFEATAME